jgi:hypothetical protein
MSLRSVSGEVVGWAKAHLRRAHRAGAKSSMVGTLALCPPYASSLRQSWIASRSLSSGAHSRDPLARNDSLENWLFENRVHGTPAVIIRERG